MSAASKKRPSRNDYESAIEQLTVAAREARGRAYAPYSKYRVGAALVTSGGTVFAGCNVENSSYGATICAERGAIMAMIAAGETEPIACVVVTAGAEPASPCGMCRQVLAEFADDMLIVLIGEGARGRLVRRDTTLARLLPDAFRFQKE